MSWLQSFCIYQVLRFWVVVTSLPMVILGCGISTLILVYPHLASGSLLLALSAFFFTLIGLMGTLAAVKKSKYATLSYGITLLLVCGVEVLLGGLFYLYLDEIRLYIEDDLTRGQQRSSKHDQKAWRHFHKNLNCCFRNQTSSLGCVDCISALRQEFHSYVPSLGTVAIFAFFFQLISACCALSYYNFYVPSADYKSRLAYSSVRQSLPRVDRRFD